MERSEAANKMMKKFDELTNPSFQPDRRRLSAVEDFFRYTEEEGESRVAPILSATLTDVCRPRHDSATSLSHARCEHERHRLTQRPLLPSQVGVFSMTWIATATVDSLEDLKVR